MKCSLCKKNDLDFVFSLGKQPLANKYPKNKNEIKNENLFDMNINFCNFCVSCTLNIDIDRNIFFSDYYYLSSVNSELVEHFNELALELKNKKFVIDIGSNDGILLRPLKNNNVKSIGIEPSENVGAMANLKGFKTIISFFDNKCAKLILEKYERPDCIVASSVFTHLDNPNQFIIDARDILDDDGVLIIEVEYLLSILKNVEFERFYFDRPYYYTLSSLKEIFTNNEMDIVDVKFIKPHGGSLRIYVKKKNNNQKISKSVLELYEEEKKLITIDYIKNQFHIFSNEINALKTKLIDLKKNNSNVKGYGAPARLATITNFGKINKDLISHIIDDSELKINRFTPGMHIPILPYDKNSNLEEVILFAYEYYDSIKKKLNNSRINFYKPIPFKKMN